MTSSTFSTDFSARFRVPEGLTRSPPKEKIPINTWLLVASMHAAHLLSTNTQLHKQTGDLPGASASLYPHPLPLISK